MVDHCSVAPQSKKTVNEAGEEEQGGRAMMCLERKE